MVEFIATILGLGIIMFFLIEIAFNPSMKSQESLGTHFMTVFKLIVISLCLVISMIILAVIIQVLQIQGATAPLYNNLVILYYIWWTFIGLCLLFLPLYYFIIVPKQMKALVAAAQNRKKDDWRDE